MRILSRSIDKVSKSGSIKVEAQESDDMYHLFNLIVEGDEIEASTMRNITHETKTGSVSKERIRLTLRLAVEHVEFDAEQCSLRISGPNVKENDYVKLGQYHTLTIETTHPFHIYKDTWDTMYMSRLEEAVDPSAKAEIAAIVMQEGLAHVCLVTPFMTQTHARIERRMPKKRDGGEKHAKAMAAFFSDIYDAMRRFVDFDLVKVVLCGSPGFLKDDFYTYSMDRATRADDSTFLKQKSKFLRGHASSGHKKAIDEMLADSTIASQMGDVKAAKEVQVLQEFYKTISDDEERAAYGFDSVLYADTQLAIKSLLVTDRFFLGHSFDDVGKEAIPSEKNLLPGAGNFELRKKHVTLADSVKEHGGNVYVFSSMHISGQQLDNFTGCAAILRFPLPEIEEEDGDDDDDMKE
jgi:protein pelota